MRKIVHLLKGDIRQISRDKTLLTFAFVPVFLILFVRFFVPYITDLFPEIKEFQSIIVMFASLQTAILYGFVSAFVILDEKDEQVLQAIRVLPISSTWFIIMRLLFGTIIAFIAAFMMMHFSGLITIKLIPSLVLSLQYALVAPIITLSIVTFAKNKVEGMAYFKGIDLILLLPVLSFFFDSIASKFLMIIPSYWTFQLFGRLIENENFIGYFLVGMIYYIILLLTLFKQFKRRVFN